MSVKNAHLLPYAAEEAVNWVSKQSMKRSVAEIFVKFHEDFLKERGRIVKVYQSQIPKIDAKDEETIRDMEKYLDTDLLDFEKLPPTILNEVTHVPPCHLRHMKPFIK